MRLLGRILTGGVNALVATFWVFGGIACFAVGHGVLIHLIGAGAIAYGLYGFYVAAFRS
jgi:hypothetical protein